MAIAVSGCSGGAVAVRSNFSGTPHAASAPVAPAAPAAVPARAGGTGNAAPGLTVSSGRNLGLAIVLVLMIADGVNWVGHKLQEAFGDAGPAGGETAPQAVTPRH